MLKTRLIRQGPRDLCDGVGRYYRRRPWFGQNYDSASWIVTPCFHKEDDLKTAW